MDVSLVPRPQWETLPFEGCAGVDGRVLLRSDQLLIALLRFGSDATMLTLMVEHHGAG